MPLPCLLDSGGKEVALKWCPARSERYKPVEKANTTRDYESTDDQGDALEVFAEALPPADL
jgi:hypothetical protein